MKHTYLKTIEISRSCNHHKRQKEDKIYPISLWMMLQPQPKNFPEGNKKWKLYHMARTQQSTLA